jgi:hypothetical protein
MLVRPVLPQVWWWPCFCTSELLLASVNRLALIAASQSNGDRTLLALNGDRTGDSAATGDLGRWMLGKVVGPHGGAESGWALLGPCAVGDLWT